MCLVFDTPMRAQMMYDLTAHTHNTLTHTLTHTHTHTRAHTHSHTRAHTLTHTHTHINHCAVLDHCATCIEITVVLSKTQTKLQTITQSEQSTLQYVNSPKYNAQALCTPLHTTHSTLCEAHQRYFH